MLIVWDEPKRLANIANHEMDFADLDEVTRVLESLAAREPEPLVREGSRGRWLHLLGDSTEAEGETETPPSRAGMEERVAALERDVTELRESLDSLRRQFE